MTASVFWQWFFFLAEEQWSLASWFCCAWSEPCSCKRRFKARKLQRDVRIPLKCSEVKTEIQTIPLPVVIRHWIAVLRQLKFSMDGLKRELDSHQSEDVSKRGKGSGLRGYLYDWRGASFNGHVVKRVPSSCTPEYKKLGQSTMCEYEDHPEAKNIGERAPRVIFKWIHLLRFLFSTWKYWNHHLRSERGR